MYKKLFIPIILGTVRQGRESEKVANYIFKKITVHPEIKTKLFDPRNMNLPMDDEGQNLKNKNPAYTKAIIKADALIIVSPEYNHGIPGSLKRTLDILLKEYIHKAVGICGVSAGGYGGIRAIETLVTIVRELGLVVTFTDLTFSKVKTLFNEKENILDTSYNDRVDRFLTELIWMAKTLRWGRENIPSKYHS
jgi:NAD(P)H-dependent FMN reductase